MSKRRFEDEENKILETIEANEKMTMSDIVEKTGLDKYFVKGRMKAMKDSGMIMCVGTVTRNRSYVKLWGVK